MASQLSATALMVDRRSGMAAINGGVDSPDWRPARDRRKWGATLPRSGPPPQVLWPR